MMIICDDLFLQISLCYSDTFIVAISSYVYLIVDYVPMYLRSLVTKKTVISKRVQVLLQR